MNAISSFDLLRLETVFKSQPMLRSGAVIVLCGEDGVPRIETGVHLVKQGAAPLLVLSGGKDDGPRWMGADRAKGIAIANGISPCQILVENDSQHTYAQAVEFTALASQHAWSRVLLVASPYHITRAFLTFVRALEREDMHESVQIIPVPAMGCPSWGCPEGMAITRMALFDGEVQKMTDYAAHVAKPSMGLDYLAFWEHAMPRGKSA